jgi:hypothetical protein
MLTLSNLDHARTRPLDPQRLGRPTPTRALRRTLARYLSRADLLILDMADAGATHRVIGHRVGLSAGTITRRLGALHRRLCDPSTHALLDPACPLADDLRKLAIQHLLLGVSLRRLADLNRLPLDAVRTRMQYAQGVLRAASARRPVTASASDAP